MNPIYATAQEYYDSLVQDATNGNFPSVGDDGQCAYRANRKADCPRRCAAGKLIPDECYIPAIENRTAADLVVRTCIPSLPKGIAYADVFDIQRCHDKTARDGKSGGNWNPRQFVARLNVLDCFTDIRTVNPETLSETLERAAALGV